jgi:vacuolar protein sorting-associated protein VTA1
MSSSLTAAAVPPSLKKIKVFLNHASELDRDRSNPESRVLAYNCRQYAVRIGIPLAGHDIPSREYLGTILGTLEREHDAMSVFTNEEQWQVCRKVADKVLNKANDEDIAGRANKITAKSFYAAATFFEVLQQFYPAEEGQEVDDALGDQITEEERRRIYCKWKATDILNAIKEGRTPLPGGFQQQQEGEQLEYLADEDNIMSPYLPPAPPPMSVSDFIQDRDGNDETNSQFTKPFDPYSPHNIVDGGGVGFELNLDGAATPSCPPEDDNLNTGNANEENSRSAFQPSASSLGTLHSPTTSKPRSPSPVATVPRTTPISSSSNTAGHFSSIASSFTTSSTKSKTTATLSKEQLADAIELTKFALAALQKGEAELGKERLEQALGVWRR